MKFISLTEFLMGRAKYEDLPDEYVRNANTLISTVNDLLQDFGQYRKVTSGYRRLIDNIAAGGAKKSAHLTCEAVDLEDKNGLLKAFCTEEILDKYNLYREEDEATPGWCHLSIKETKSGRRIFKP